MVLPESIIESLKNHLKNPDIKILVASEWGSQNPSHRDLIRAKLTEIQSDQTPYSSVSHCEGAGVIILAPFPVGVDVEVTSRVAEKIIARVSSPEELQHASSTAALWCAKEACFKALRSYRQPSVISEISIGAWQNLDSQIETYQLLNPENFNSPSRNHGFSVHFLLHTYSFFIFPS